jgi:hypothetical protein
MNNHLASLLQPRWAFPTECIAAAINGATIAKCGKSQVPYIFDDATSIGLYDSKLILSYLEETYGKGQIEL